MFDIKLPPSPYDLAEEPETTGLPDLEVQRYGVVILHGQEVIQTLDGYYSPAMAEWVGGRAVTRIRDQIRAGILDWAEFSVTFKEFHYSVWVEQNDLDADGYLFGKRWVG